VTQRAWMQEALHRTVADLPSELRAEPRFLVGAVAHVLAEQSELGVDLMVIGSRAHGPLRSAWLGSVSGDLIRISPRPLVITPPSSSATVQRRRPDVPFRGHSPGSQTSRSAPSSNREFSDMADTSVDCRATPLPPGTRAPGFELRSTPDQTVSLEEFRGQPVILAFYPGDWSPVCSDQMALYQELLPEFGRFGAELLGISVDSAWSHLAFATDRNLHFPLLADFEPKGEVARSYDVYRAQDGTSERALFVIDADGVVRWSYVSPVGVNPGADGILRALETLGES
jgi:peroxiredoxin